MSQSNCSDCPLAARREFIGGITRILSSVMVASHVWPGSAVAVEYLVGRKRGDLVVYPIPGDDGATIDRDAQVIVVRHRQAVFAFARTCPHQNTALRWQGSEMRFKCPKHNSRYEPDGRFIDGRATRGMDRFAIWRDGANIVVDPTQVFKQDEDPRGWESARVDL